MAASVFVCVCVSVCPQTRHKHTHTHTQTRTMQPNVTVVKKGIFDIDHFAHVLFILLGRHLFRRLYRLCCGLVLLHRLVVVHCLVYRGLVFSLVPPCHIIARFPCVCVCVCVCVFTHTHSLTHSLTHTYTHTHTHIHTHTHTHTLNHTVPRALRAVARVPPLAFSPHVHLVRGASDSDDKGTRFRV
jgi:hypothetical protein